MNKNSPKFRLPAILAILSLLGLFACNGDLLNSLQNKDYRIQGLVVVDQNSASRTVTAKIWREDTLFSDADLMADTLVVPYLAPFSGGDGAYYRHDTESNLLKRDNLEITLTDSTNSYDFMVIVPDSFSILSLQPFTHIVGGLSDNVTLSWSGSAGTEGYILAAVKADSAYRGKGYVAAVSTNATGGTIPPDAFALPSGIQADTGLYNVYVYALTGSPDSALASSILPTPIPEQFADVYNETHFSGWFGAIRVVYRDTVRVVTNP